MPQKPMESPREYMASIHNGDVTVYTHDWTLWPDLATHHNNRPALLGAVVKFGLAYPQDIS